MALWVCVNDCIERLFVSEELISAGSLVSCVASISSGSIVHVCAIVFVLMLGYDGVWSKVYELLAFLSQSPFLCAACWAQDVAAHRSSPIH